MFFGMCIFEIVNSRCENVQTCDFRIFDAKSLTRPYVFQVVFSCFVFSNFLFNILFFLNVFILKILDFWRRCSFENQTFRNEKHAISRIRTENRWHVRMFATLFYKFIVFLIFV